MNKDLLLKVIFILLLFGCIFPQVTAPVALVAGIAYGISVGNPWAKGSAVWSKRLLQLSVVGLGFGMNLPELLKTSKDAFVYTAVSISFTMIVGLLLGKALKINQRTSSLISFGSAICGGSAIAAMAPVIKAKTEEIGVALATVFTLNSVALIVFPPLGHIMGMTECQFGLWSALAIHDTSSVVGAAAAYGTVALAIGTTVKLTRALWIMPASIVASWFVKSDTRAKFPLFILGFILAAVVRTLVPQLDAVWDSLHGVARQSLVVTLFLIGTGLTRIVLAGTGIKPLAQGVVLWAIVSASSSFAIMYGWIS